MSDPALILRARNLRAARGVVVARDVTVAVLLGLLIVRETPLTPLLRLSTHPSTVQTPVAGPAAWLCLPGLALVAVAAFLAARLT